MSIPFFTNLTAFSLNNDDAQQTTFLEQWSIESLEAALATRPFRPCGTLDKSSAGWVSPMDDGRFIYHVPAKEVFIMKLRVQEKILPAAVVRQYLDEKIAKIEKAENRQVRRKERNETKEKIVLELLSQALVKNTDYWLYLDFKNNWVVVNVPSISKAETIISHLRTTLGSLPAYPFLFQQHPSSTMTEWLKNKSFPENLLIGKKCKLDSGEGDSVTYRQGDLYSEEVEKNLSAGKRVTYLELVYKTTQFTLTDQFVFKSVEQVDILEDEEPNTVIMILLVEELISHFLEQFGVIEGGE